MAPKLKTSARVLYKFPRHRFLLKWDKSGKIQNGKPDFIELQNFSSNAVGVDNVLIEGAVEMNVTGCSRTF